jgi:PPK2 family polyphosphate:nucleotide phosphotransferase
MSNHERFLVKPGKEFDLSSLDPGETGKDKSKASSKMEMAELSQKMCDLQGLLYAEGRHALLICLQALDAGGKDGTIVHVFGAMNPLGTRVHAFKVPTDEEARHDFLWRVHQQTPRKGEVAIFNRSHYEDVLIVRVHDLVPKPVWSRRYDLINDFEKNLTEAGTTILKFFLHISKDEQLRRFKKRLDNPDKNWKVNEADYEERKRWPEYMKAYEDALSKTSTEIAPWFVIPADHKWYRNLAVARIVVDTMESLGMKRPPATADIEEIRRKYHTELAKAK